MYTSGLTLLQYVVERRTVEGRHFIRVERDHPRAAAVAPVEQWFRIPRALPAPATGHPDPSLPRALCQVVTQVAQAALPDAPADPWPA